MKIRAIVLDDNYTIRTIMSGILKERGYEVYSSSEPLSSPIYRDSSCPYPEDYRCTTIVISDINMPNMSGFEFIEHQRSKGCKIQNIALMSGRWTKKDIKQARKLGCHMFTKPFKKDEVEKWLDECEKELDHNRKLTDMQTFVN